MKILLKEVQAFKQVFDFMFPNAFSTDIAESRRPIVSTSFFPASQGTLLIAEDSHCSLTRVISSRPCTDSLACSADWLDDYFGDTGHIDVSTRRNLVEFSSTKGSESRVLSLFAQRFATSWASPLMAAVNERFLATLIELAGLSNDPGSTSLFHRIDLDGSRGAIVAQPFGEAIIYPGFKFPWAINVSVPASSIFASLGLTSSDQVTCGVLDRSFYLSAGPWRLKMPAQVNMHGFDCDAEKKGLGRASNSLALDSRDLQLLLDHLHPYTGILHPWQRVFLYLTDQVAVLVHTPIPEEGYSEKKCLMLRRSTQKGKPTIIPIQSWRLRRLAERGLSRVQWHDVARKLVGINDHSTHIMDVVPASSEMAQIDSLDYSFEIDSLDEAVVAS